MQDAACLLCDLCGKPADWILESGLKLCEACYYVTRPKTR